MRSLRILLAAVVGLAAGSVSAASVYVDSPLVTSDAPNAGTFAADLGEHSFLNGSPYDFTLQLVAGEGRISAVTRVGEGGRPTLSWGAFTTPPGGTNAATRNGTLAGANASSPASQLAAIGLLGLLVAGRPRERA